ncbi:MAG: antitoxin family protein [Candidatus Methanofastidiosia archaeon]
MPKKSMEIEVIYEDGVFKPLKKVDLKEGDRGVVTLRELEIVRKSSGMFKGKYESGMRYEIFQ